MAAAATLTLAICARRQLRVSHPSIGCGRAHLAPCTFPLAPQLSSKRGESSHSLPGLFESYRGTPRQHHCALCAVFFLPSSPSPVIRAAATLMCVAGLCVVCAGCGRAVVLTAHSPGNPAHTGRRFPRLSPASCCCH